MQSPLLSALRAQHAGIRARWAALLHVEPVSTPLANPDALVHLIDWSLKEVFRGLTALASRRRAGHITSDSRPHCPCGRNPLLAYFAAGEQAVQEALILAQAASPALSPVERDTSLRELNVVLRDIARREIESFCGVCQHRDEASQCPAKRPLLLIEAGSN